MYVLQSVLKIIIQLIFHSISLKNFLNSYFKVFGYNTRFGKYETHYVILR